MLLKNLVFVWCFWKRIEDILYNPICIVSQSLFHVFEPQM